MEDGNSLSREERKQLRKKRREEKALKLVQKDKESSVAPENGSEDLKPPKAPKLIPNRDTTVSIAVAGSVLDNAQSPPLRAYLAGQIARAAAIFNVDEIVVFDDTGGKAQAACQQMARILQFMECPQYLRKYLFPLHPDLKFAGVMSPLDIPHHLRKDEVLRFREGAISDLPVSDGKGSFVYIGLEKQIKVDQVLPENTRVTVQLDNPELCLERKGKLRGKLVSPRRPKIEDGIYWGYTVRTASSLSQVVSECSFKGGYDVIIGTSEKGTPVSSLTIDSYKRMLIVFGGVEGLEYAFESDEQCKEETVEALFHHYVNTCPAQGSRTIRTEEAILISLTALQPILNRAKAE